MTRRTLAVAALIALTGCTAQEITAWTRWWQQHPDAATEYANRPDVQHNLEHDWDGDGIVEPEPVIEAESPDDFAGVYDDTVTESYGWTVWDDLAECESGGDWSISTGNGYYGGLQFSLGSWQAAGGGSGYPHQYSRGEQIAVAENLLDMQGWGAWPACSAQLGLR